MSYVKGNSPYAPDANALASIMSKMSEDLYGASWAPNLEYRLWKLLIIAPHSWTEEVERLRRFSRDCCGWIIWKDGGPTWVPLHEWMPLYAAKGPKEEEPPG